MEILEKIKSSIAEINKKKEQLTASLRSDFAPMLKPLFEKSKGKITSIGWTQHTPYFNDGDECVFSTHMDLDYGLYLNGEMIEEQEGLFGSSAYALSKFGTPQYDSWIERYPEDKINEETKESDLFLYSVLKEFQDVLTSIDDSFYKDLFGDHVKVTVNEDGTVETESYEHD